MLLESLRARVISRGARNYRAYAELAAAYEERAWSSNGTAQPRDPHAGGPRRRDHALERALHALDLEDGAGARRRAARSCSSRPSGRRSPARCSPTSPPRPACRPGSSTSSRESARASARRSSPTRRRGGSRSPARRRRRRAIGARRRRQPRPLHRRARRQGPAAWSSTTPTSTTPPRRAARMYDDSGQVCLAGTRLLVAATRSPRSSWSASDAAVDAHVLGDPREPETTISPLIHPDHLARVEGFVERARAAGDRIVCGGRRAEVGGARRALVRADPDRAALQRLRGRPARGLRPGAHLPDLRATRRRRSTLANSTAYGLSAIVCTELGRRARNGSAARSAPAPPGSTPSSSAT